MSETVRKSLTSTLRGTAFILFGAVGSMVVWFVVKVILARTITKEELGIYSLATSIASAVITISCSGIGDGITRFASMYLADDKEADARAASIATTQLSFWTGIILSIAVFFLAPMIARYGFYMPNLAVPIQIVAFTIFFSQVTQILTGIVRAYADTAAYIINMVGQPVLFSIGFGITLLLSKSLDGVLYAHLATSAILFAVIMLYTKKRLGFNPLQLRGGKHTLEILRFSLPLVGAAVVGMIFTWTDTFMVGRYCKAEDVGVFNIAITLARTLPFVLSGMGFILMPVASDLFAKNQHAELLRTYQVLTKWVFFLTLPMFFVTFFFPEPTTVLLFGDKYSDSAMPLRILSIGMIVNVFFGANYTILLVYGLSRTIFQITAASALLNVALNYMLIKGLGLGVVGAAVSTSLAYIFNSLLSASLLYRFSKIHPFTIQYLRPLIHTAAASALIFALSRILPLSVWLLPLYFVLFIVGFASIFLLTKSIDPEDIFLFDSVTAKTGLRAPRLREFLLRHSKIQA